MTCDLSVSELTLWILPMSRSLIWLRALVLAALALALAGCVQTPGRSDNYPVTANGPYLLDTGDVLRISVYGETSLTNSYTVGADGTISMPLIGPVRVAGLTTRAVAGKITAALANGYMRSPNVAVEVAQYRPFYIQGAVTKSGQYPYVYGMTVRAAISTAGGYTETANRGQVTIYRPQTGQMQKGKVDLDFPIAPGDTIVVPERWF